MENPLTILFLCSGNWARSQMAEASLRRMPQGRIPVASAGTLPRPEIHPLARKVVKDLFGLEMEGQHPRSFVASRMAAEKGSRAV